MPICQQLYSNPPDVRAAVDAFIHNAQEQAYEAAVLYPTIHDWIEWSLQERTAVMIAEEPIDRERRMALEQEQAPQPVPGRRGPKVFLWEQTEQGYWLRYQILNDRQDFVRQL